MLAALPLLFFAAAAALADNTLSDRELLRALRAGGYNLYFRHAATDWSRADHVGAVGDWVSCDPLRIRQLSEDGRRTAKAVGVAMRALEIPVGAVFSSPYCRTVETARLLDLGPVETTTDVMNMRVAEYFGGRQAIAARTRVRLATPPAPGTNTVYVAHGNVAREATAVYPGEGECIVFRPDGQGGFEFAGRFTPEDWQRLTAR